MKSLLVLALGLLAVPAFAASGNQIDQEVAEAITADQARIYLVNGDGEPIPAEYQLKALLKGQPLRAENVRCQDVTPDGLLGAGQFECEIYVNSVAFTARATRVVYPGAKAKLKSNKLPAVVILRG